MLKPFLFHRKQKTMRNPFLYVFLPLPCLSLLCCFLLSEILSFVFSGEGGEKKKENGRAALEVQTSASTNTRSKLPGQPCQHDKAGNANLNFGSKFGCTLNTSHSRAVFMTPECQDKSHARTILTFESKEIQYQSSKTNWKIKPLNNLKKTECITAKA